MHIFVTNKIIVNNPTNDIKQFCRDKLVLKNPDFYKKQQMGKWTGNIQQNIVLYEKDGDTYYLPFGVVNNVLNMANMQAMTDIKPFKALNYQSNINLYPYQEKAVNEAIKAKNGIIVMPCGAGKTQTALELIARLGGKTLWLTHTKDLLNQSLARAKSTLGIAQSTYGTITDGKVNIGTGITFATVQTMSKLDLAQYKHSFDIIIVDECHKAIGSPTKCMQFYKVLSALACRYKYGITATPKRADGLEGCMFSLLGDKIVEIDKDAVKGTTCKVKVRQIHTDYMPNMDCVLAGDGTIDYASLVRDMVSNADRMMLVANELEDLKCEGGAILVLANRVEYLQWLCDRFCKYGLGGDAICLSNLGNSKGAKQVRKQALIDLNSGKLDAVFATYQLAKEGLDCPNLRYVVFATPEKDETTVIQSAGRVGRKADGKEYGTVIDFVDDFGLYKGWAKQREKIYKKLEYELEDEEENIFKKFY